MYRFFLLLKEKNLKQKRNHFLKPHFRWRRDALIRLALQRMNSYLYFPICRAASWLRILRVKINFYREKKQQNVF